MATRKLRQIFIVLVFMAAIIVPKAETADPVSSEYLVKAAFVYNFAKFIEWPPGAFFHNQASVIFGIVGRDPFGAALDSIRGKTVKGRKVVIKRFAEINNMEKCHILFIAKSETKNLVPIFAGIKDWNVLTISDMESFAKQGGIINFVTVRNKIRFEINILEAEKAGLKISSNLLKLATIVKNDTR